MISARLWWDSEDRSPLIARGSPQVDTARRSARAAERFMVAACPAQK
jgi:hypothetical protein